jgi:hypothetical protein
MSEHVWTDPADELSYTVSERNATGDRSTQAALCREILRLAEESKALKTAAARVLELVFGGDWNTGKPGDPIADAVSALRALLKE